MLSHISDSPRRQQIIDAAGRLFRASGFRAVTMEAIAAEARVAKATLYSHFPDKNVLFAAVADHVMRLIADAMQQELGAKGEIDERLARGLIAWHKRIFQLVDGSSHARELMYVRDRVAHAPVEKIDAQMIAALSAVVREDPVLAKSAGAVASTLFFGATGVASHARSSVEIETEVGNFVRPYLFGLRALAKSRVAGGPAASTKPLETGNTDVLRHAAGSGRK